MIKHMVILQRLLLALIFVSATSFLSGCNFEKIKVDEDAHFNTLFTRSGGGFTGADGTYSVYLPDGRTVWIFGDTFLGTVNADSTRRKMNPMYIRNAFVVQDDTMLTTLYTGTTEDYHSLIIPPKVKKSDGELTENQFWYWPGDGFAQQDTLKVFLSEFEQVTDDMWGFEWKSTALAEFLLPGFEQVALHEIPTAKVDSIHFGHAVLKDKGFLYMYGLRNGKPYAARTNLKNILGDWEYFSEGKWTRNVKGATPILDINISEQFSVFKLGNTYYLLTQLGDFSNDVWVFHADEPDSWETTKGKKIFTIDIPFNNSELFTYNALAHPQFIDDQERLLVSYNMNSHKLQDLFQNAHIYKPRFLRVPIHDLK